MARTAARLLAARGLTIVSGLATGVDTAAHREALRLGARTVAVIGAGVNHCHPACNRGLQEEIAARGLVISQFAPDQPPAKWTFPARNHVMAAYSLAAIVVEAGEWSGSRIMARATVSLGRPVILSARVAEGTRWGAAMAQSPAARVAGSTSELAAAIDDITAHPE
jgi:DNA processing protein